MIFIKWFSFYHNAQESNILSMNLNSPERVKAYFLFPLPNSLYRKRELKYPPVENYMKRQDKHHFKI